MPDASGAPLPHFKFVQLEFPWELGPDDGRYVVRGHAGEVDQIVVTQTLGAPERRGFVRNRRARMQAPRTATRSRRSIRNSSGVSRSRFVSAI